MSHDPSNPPYPPDPSFAYQPLPYQPYGSAPTLTKLAGIFNCIMAGMDLLYALGIGVFAILVAAGVIPQDAFDDKSAFPPPGGGPHVYSGPPIALIYGITGAISVVALAAGIVKLIAGIKMLRRKPGAWGWSLAGGIFGCTQLWCSYFCVLPMGIGVFTIVVCCLDTVRRYLRDAAAGTLAPESLP
jgi:hypothetical protein